MVLQVMLPTVLRVLRQLQQESQQAANNSVPQRPMLFAVMSGHTGHSGASTAFQCRLFQNLPGQQVVSTSCPYICIDYLAWRSLLMNQAPKHSLSTTLQGPGYMHGTKKCIRLTPSR